jgi:uncharacterized protein
MTLSVPSWRARIEQAIAPALIERVPREHTETAGESRRRRIVVAISLVVGAVLLGFSLSVRPGDSLFYVLTGAVAVTWFVGGLASGPLHLGYIPFRGTLRRPIITPIVIGLLASGVFIVGALIVREIPPLRDLVQNVLAHARGSVLLITVVTVANGIAEEVFFRGGLYSALGRRRPVLISTVVDAVATVATGNPMLVFAALTLGFVLGLQRRASGGILAPMLTHVTWSTIMLFALPPLFPH